MLPAMVMPGGFEATLNDWKAFPSLLRMLILPLPATTASLKVRTILASIETPVESSDGLDPISSGASGSMTPARIVLSVKRRTRPP